METGKLVVQRVAVRNYNWQIRFGFGELITTVSVDLDSLSNLEDAISSGARMARERFETMQAFNSRVPDEGKK